MLYAFNLEIGRIRDVVREPLAAQMRFAWWRDQLHRISTDEPLSTPLGRELAAIVARNDLPVDLLQGLLDARADELLECPFADEPAFEAYALNAVSGLMKLAARVCGAGGQADHVAGPAGLAQARVSVIRQMPADASRRHCYLPLSFLAAHGLTPEDVFAGKGPILRPAVFAWATKALQAIREARNIAIPKAATAAILPAVLARQFVPRLQAPDFDPFAPGLQLVHLTAAVSLARAAWTRRL